MLFVLLSLTVWSYSRLFLLVCIVLTGVIRDALSVAVSGCSIRSKRSVLASSCPAVLLITCATGYRVIFITSAALPLPGN